MGSGSGLKERLSVEEVVELLKNSGLLIDVGDVFAVEWVGRDSVRVVLVRSGVAAEVYLTRRDGKWFRTPLKLHEIVKFVDAGVRL